MVRDFIGIKLSSTPLLRLLSTLTLTLSLHVSASDTGVAEDVWPAEWKKPMPVASKVGIKKFKQSPYLDKLVKEGKLPPVEERLPEDPPVSYPLESIGKYGGTLHLFEIDLSGPNPIEGPLTIGPSCVNILPNIARKWEYTNGGKTFTLFIRKGLKWSDGHPFTAEDFVFRVNYMLFNKDLSPVTMKEWVGASVEKIDDYTIKYNFPKPYPFFINDLAQRGDNYYCPAHFLKNYHPSFVPKEELERHSKKKGYLSWMNYIWAAWKEGGGDVFGTPVMTAYKIVSKKPTMYIFERNPYFYKIDPEGNQLPYIDKIEAERTNNQEIIAAKVSTGQVDFAGKNLLTADIPLYKTSERAGKVDALIWRRLHGVDVIIQPNLASEKKEMSKLFLDFRFRKAMSIALNREEMNQVIYFGKGVPRQATVIPPSKYYDPVVAKMYTEYNPKEANKLLDEMGLKDIDGDGFREYPNGKTLTILLEWVKLETPKEMTLELASEYWAKVGLNIQTKEINSNLQGARCAANMMDMTAWHADRTTDILFPTQPFWFAPIHTGWEECHLVPWANWFRSDGKQGEEPPPEFKRLQDIHNEDGNNYG